MKIEIIGSGGAFDEISSSYLVNDKYLVDCGESAINQLIERNLIDGVTDIFVTHIHQDHIGGLEKFLYYRLITRGDWENPLDLTIHCGKDVQAYYKTLAVSKNSRNIILNENGENEGTYYQPFKFNSIANDSDSIVKDDLFINPMKAEHMNGAIPCYGYIFVNNQNRTRAYFTGDTDTIPKLIDKNTINDKMKIFMDMGWTGVPKQDVKYHPDEQEVFDKLGYSDNIIGTHTNAELKYYKKANPGDIFIID